MFAFLSPGTELRRFTKGTLPKIAIAVLLFIPLIYGALYLWAFWAPTDELKNLPVALVNEDTGAVRDGEHFSAGNDVTKELLDGKDLAWTKTDAADATAGVSNGEYYFSVTIPKNFSESAVSAGTDAPTQAVVQVNYNDSNSFLASTLGKQAMVQLRDTVALNIGDQTVNTLLVGLHDAGSGIRDAAAGATTLANGLDTAKAGAGDLVVGLATLADGTATVQSGADKLNTGAHSLADGLATLNSGASTLSGKSGELASGANQLSTGAAGLHAGTTQVSGGAGQLVDGSHTLATALTEGSEKIPNDSSTMIDKKSTVISNPVALDETWDNQSSSFGEGFAPFFLALATFVGALITWLILRALPTRALATSTSGIRTVMTGFLPAMAIGLGQVIIMVLVLVYGIGLEPTYWLGMSAFIYLTTLAFQAMQQMFIILLGSAAGRVVSLVLLMMQLSSSGGTYPVETTPGFFQALHPFMPASWVVTGLRELITGGIDYRLWVSVALLLILLVASLAISAMSASKQRVWTIKRLHPELTI